MMGYLHVFTAPDPLSLVSYTAHKCRQLVHTYLRVNIYTDLKLLYREESDTHIESNTYYLVSMWYLYVSECFRSGSVGLRISQDGYVWYGAIVWIVLT